jgi:hypothetical protein
MRQPRKVFIGGKLVGPAAQPDIKKKEVEQVAAPVEVVQADTVVDADVVANGVSTAPVAAGTDAERAASARDTTPQIKEDEKIIAKAGAVIARVRRRIGKK